MSSPSSSNTVSSFVVWDYLVFAAMLVVSSGIGLYYRFSGGKQQTEKEYLMGDKSMSVVPVAFSLMASFMSAITLLGVSQENYTFGTQFVVINLAYIVGTPIAAYVYLPVFFRLQTTSAYEYLERRFGRPTRLLASLVFSLQMVLYMSIVVYAPALALSAVTGLSYLGSILAVGGVCTFYSTLGGMKAVLITDVFQSLLMFAAIFAVIICGSINLGGLDEVFARANEGNRFQFFDFDPDPTVRHTFWSQLIGGLFIFLSIYAVNQAQVQRLLSIGELRQSQRSLWLQWPILTLLSLSTSLAGLTIYAYYQDCDPIAAKRIQKGDQLLPLFVIDTMRDYPGLPGLFVSGIFSGSLSTVSSAINSLAAVTMEDYLKMFWKPSHPALVLKVLAFLYGLACIGLTFLVELLGPGILQASLTIFGVVGGPLLGLFTLGMVFRMGNQPGALTGLVTSLAFLFWIGFGGPKPKAPTLGNGVSSCPAAFMTNVTILSAVASFNSTATVSEDAHYFYLYRISYAWYALIGFVVCLSVGLASSFAVEKIFGREAKNQNPDLFVTWIREAMLKKSCELECRKDEMLLE